LTNKPGIDFDPDELHRRYLAERDKRLRNDGLAQYVRMEGELAHYADDPRAASEFSRPPLSDEVDVVIVGGGFSGLITAGKLRLAGVADIRIIEGGADFGGTWYWNRYPGIRCDVESYCYMPFLEELEYIPSEKYARGEEIFAHCQAIAKHFGLYENACLRTRVTGVEWDDRLHRWVISTNRDDRIKARFVCLAGGSLHRPKLPGITGIEEFEGVSFHTSRWRYDYTGGDSTGNLTGLRGKRIGIIGTGATALQCVPYLAEYAQHLYVFQRTPSTVDVRNNMPTSPGWAETLQPGWQRERMVNFTAIVSGIKQDKDLVNDGWTDIWSKLWMTPSADGESDIDPEEMMQLVDYTKMEQIRARIDSVVTDRATAESLKPWYNLFCKRPGYSDEYLQAFNRSNVTLVDTRGQGVERITPKGAVFEGTEYELDCLIYATGFTVAVLPYESGEYEVVGRTGEQLKDHWADGCRSIHGLITNGFPNLFVQGHAHQAALSVNVPHALGEQAEHVAAIISRCLREGVVAIEARPEAEQAWAKVLAEKAVDRTKFKQECTPGYFNNEGKIEGPFGTEVYGGGPLDYMDVIREWRSTRLEEDLELTYE
jgi:cation diffusion facilitator CzcD-associated flavoprotein CzcO